MKRLWVKSLDFPTNSTTIKEIIYTIRQIMLARDMGQSFLNLLDLSDPISHDLRDSNVLFGTEINRFVFKEKHFLRSAHDSKGFGDVKSN